MNIGLFRQFQNWRALSRLRRNISGDTSQHRNRSQRAGGSLQGRIDLLGGKNAVLMKMHLDNGTSFREISRLAGLSERTVARRIRRMAGTLMAGQYLSCLRYRDRFNWVELDIAKEYFLMGMSLKSIARRRRWSYHRARKALTKIEGLLERSQRPKQTRACHAEPFAALEGKLREASQHACHAEQREASGHRTKSFSQHRTADCRAVSIRKPDSSASPQNDTRASGPQNDTRATVPQNDMRTSGPQNDMRAAVPQHDSQKVNQVEYKLSFRAFAGMTHTSSKLTEYKDKGKSRGGK